MPVVKLTLDEYYYKKLKEKAGSEGMSMQDYIKSCVFSEEYIFSPAEAMKRALKETFRITHSHGETFTLPDLYTDDEWSRLTKGQAGAFGRSFNEYVEIKKPGTIKWTEKGGRNGQRAEYILIV